MGAQRTHGIEPQGRRHNLVVSFIHPRKSRYRGEHALLWGENEIHGGID